MNPNEIIIIVGLLLAALELLLGVPAGFDLVLTGSILIISGIIGSIASNFTVTLVVAIVLSVFYIAYGRSLIRQKLIIATKGTNVDKLIGSHGVVIRSITPETPGMVRVEDEDWRAVSEEVLYEKDKIEVTSISGVSLKVKKRI
jgi:membrane protein implicated in regulation of membrane protease activity